MSIVWIASYPKSGNTWLRKTLQAYIGGPPFRLNGGLPCMRGDLNPHDYQILSVEPLDRLDYAAQIHLRPAALWNMVKRNFDKRLYVKTHHQLQRQLGIDMIPRHLTEGAIYLVRDPRDVAVSYAHHLGITVDVAIEHIGADECTMVDWEHPIMWHGIGAWSGHVQNWTSMESDIPRCILKYEDLVRAPKTHFREVIKFLGLKCNKKQFDWALDVTRFDNLQKLEGERGFGERPKHNDQFFRKGKVGNWRDVLSTEQVAHIEQHHGTMMRQMGYELVSEATVPAAA